MSVVRSLFCGVLCLTVLAGVGCPKRGPSFGDDPRARCVNKFLNAMVDDDAERMAKLISQEWLDAEGIDLDDYQVNAYSPRSYIIEKVKGDKVTAVIRFASGGAHRLQFKVSQENGKYYIVPGEADSDGWIHPWIDVETDIDE